MKSYIVRIYREGQGNPRGMIGVVEETATNSKKAFTNIDELLEILNPRRKSRAKSGKAGTRAG